MDDVVKVLRDFGFPTAVAAFVLYRIEPALKNLTAAITELRLCLASRERARTRAQPKAGRGRR